MNPDGTGLKRLTRVGVAPAWSPDGRMIAFKVIEKARGIWLMRANGTHQRRLGIGASPAWSPDGKQIVFTKYDYGGGIYLMRVDGTHVRRVITTGFRPRWSPSGRQIVYWNIDQTTQTEQIFVVSVDGGTPRQLTSARTEDNFDPTWSPDGRKIAYARSDRGNCRNARSMPASIFVMNADGSAKTKIYTVDAKSCVFTDLTWSPDGKKFAFSEYTGRGFAIELINADGSARKRLIDQHGGHGISWQSLPGR